MKPLTDFLIVEDDPIVRQASEKVLVSEGFTVDMAPTAETASLKLSAKNYKMILCDLMLPNENGLGVLKQALSDQPSAVVVIITGYSTLENAIKSFRAGAFDFLPKPFDVEELMGVVERGMNYLDLVGGATHEDRGEELNRTPLHTADDYYFLGAHSWAKLDEDGTALFGTSETFPKLVGEIDRIEFPSRDEEITQGNALVRLISRRGYLHSVWAPLSGRTIEINQELEQNPSLILSLGLFSNWLVRVLPAHLEAELNNLSLARRDEALSKT
jgi:CheY-like chemotaxis protein